MNSQSSTRSVPSSSTIFEWLVLVGAVSAILALGWRGTMASRSDGRAVGTGDSPRTTTGLLERGLDAADGWLANVGTTPVAPRPVHEPAGTVVGRDAKPAQRTTRQSTQDAGGGTSSGLEDGRVERVNYEYERQDSAAVRPAASHSAAPLRDERAPWRGASVGRASLNPESSLDEPLDDEEVTDEELEMERRSFVALESAERSRGFRVAQAIRSGAAGGGGAGGSGASAPAASPSSSAAASKPAAVTAAPSGGKSRKDEHKQLKQAIGGLEQKIATALDSGFYVAAETSFLSPLREPHQVVAVKDLVTQQAWGQGSESGVGAGFRLTAGMMPQDQGFRVRWFTMESDHLTMAPPVPTLTKPAFSSSSYVSINAVDLEYTQRFCAAGHRIDSSFGMRLADIELQSNTVGYGDVGNGVSLYGMAMAANELQGVGFTGSLGGHVCLAELFGGTGCGPDDSKGGAAAATTNNEGWPCWLSAWGLYYNFRGSVLWSDASVSVLTDANAVVQGDKANGSAFSRNKAHSADDGRGATGNFDMQIGLEYQRCLQRLPSNLFFRVGLEYQRWGLGDLGASSRSEAFLLGVAPAYGGQVVAMAQRTDNYLDLFGIAVSLGLTY